MLEELNITKTEGGLIASWNFFGYLCGSLLSISSIFKKRVKLVFFISIVLSISTTFLMSIDDQVIFFIIIRFISGLSSAFVLIFGTALIKDPFHSNRWDYYYSIQVGDELLDEMKLSINFNSDGLVDNWTIEDLSE